MPTKINEKLSSDNYYHYYVSYGINPEIISGRTKCALKQRIMDGYAFYTLYSSNKLKNNFSGQHLSYFIKDRSFIPTTDMVINHINEKKLENNRDNLKRVTCQQNTAHSKGKKTYRYRKNEIDGTFTDEMEYNSMNAAARSVLHLTQLKQCTIAIQIKESFNFEHDVLGFYWSAVPLQQYVNNRI